jgi:hypothetical protein
MITQTLKRIKVEIPIEGCEDSKFIKELQREQEDY